MWSKEQDETLVRLWNEGKSAAQVAAAMRLPSRSAVIGRMHRLKAKGVQFDVHVHPIGQRRLRRLGGPTERKIRLVKPCKPPEPIVDTLEGSASFEERTGCKWPVTPAPPHRFCNRETFGDGPYCEGHLVRAVQPSRTREMRPGKYERQFG